MREKGPGISSKKSREISRQLPAISNKGNFADRLGLFKFEEGLNSANV